MKLSKLNIVGWLLLLIWGISGILFKEELSIITTSIGGLLFLVTGLSLAFYKVNNRSKSN
ncbi:hypothetical protein [Fredinandcohnia sp. 179-A 10B2 NHS]|uniref:hypothetical protein n=1 Tax=Fredinandcohnia sp. 179-A 10B2 NHS TaxID=3235176 RepID=UPI0039A0F02D